MNPPLVVFTAAHAGFAAETPLGGGATIAHWLTEDWSQHPRFDFRVLGPGPRSDARLPFTRVELPAQLLDLPHLTERQYARFCHAFERAITRSILELATRQPVHVLSNDLSEGPDFAALAARQVPITTIFHVDVVDYFCRFYLAGVRPERMTHSYERLRRCGLHRFLPALVRLVFEKQRAAVRHSRSLLVPSEPMREIILRCYQETPPDRIVVVPWGGREEPFDEGEVQVECRKLLNEYSLLPEERMVCTLGRLSPEKGIERLLEALLRLDTNAPPPFRTLIAGAPAFMRGERYLRALRRQVARLRNLRVDFVGHVTGARKQALLQLADLFVHPSRHESYGLTVVEAMRAGCGVLTTEHYSARALITEDCGRIVPHDPRGLAAELRQLLSSPESLRAMGESARQRAKPMRFADASARIADLMLQAASQPPSTSSTVPVR